MTWPLSGDESEHCCANYADLATRSMGTVTEYNSRPLVTSRRGQMVIVDRMQTVT